MRLPLLLSIGLLCIGAVHAQDIEAPRIDAAPLSVEEKQALQDQSKALHDKASRMRDDAEAAFAAESQACWQKFLVSSCQKDAKKAKTVRQMEANVVEKEAREIDRRLRKSNFSEHQATQTEQAPKRAIDAAEQAEKNRKAREEAMARVEKKQHEAEQREQQR